MTTRVLLLIVFNTKSKSLQSSFTRMKVIHSHHGNGYPNEQSNCDVQLCSFKYVPINILPRSSWAPSYDLTSSPIWLKAFRIHIPCPLQSTLNPNHISPFNYSAFPTLILNYNPFRFQPKHSHQPRSFTSQQLQIKIYSFWIAINFTNAPESNPRAPRHATHTTIASKTPVSRTATKRWFEFNRKRERTSEKVSRPTKP